jgi:hypothetical protein
MNERLPIDPTRNENGLIRLSIAIIVGSACMIGLNGCDSKQKKVSDDIGALRKIVNLNMQATSAQWEIYGYPEASGVGFLPVNSDLFILMAELTPSDTRAMSIALPQDTPYWAYNVARPWLDGRFRALLGKAEQTSVDISSKSRCRPLTAVWRKTDKPVNGFICQVENKALVYLVIASHA